MPRLYAQNRTSMWADEDFRALSSDAQNLYNYLLAHPSTTYAGVGDWFPKRLAHVNVSWDVDRVEEIGRELAAGHFVVIDEDWDEFCIRSFLRWEQVLKVPNLARATAHAFEKVESPRLQRVIIHELLRLREEFPTWSAWDLDEYADILIRRPPLDGKTIDSPINGSGNSTADPSGNPPPDPTPRGPRKGSVKGSANPSLKGSEVTSNQYLVPPTPEPGPSNGEPVADDGEDDDEFTARQKLKNLELDYVEVRKAIVRYCERDPKPLQVFLVGSALLTKPKTKPRHPLAYVVGAVKQDWAVVQQMLDAVDAA